VSDVIAIKTTSNEEVVAKLVKDEEDFIIIGKPRALVMQQMRDGSVSLGMLPFMASANNPEFTTESDVKLYKKDIMAEVVEVPESLATAYLQQVSGIQLVK
jgi:hypothetical protein